MELNKIYAEDCLQTMANMESNLIDLTVTSPPYDGLRKYNGYSFDFENTAHQLFRVTKPGGVVVWVVGDSTVKGTESGTSFRQALFFKDCGFNLHDTMIYEKNSSAFPAKRDGNRYTQIFEYMFIFCKGSIKTAHLLADKPNRWVGYVGFGKQTQRQDTGELIEKTKKPTPEFSPRNNIWRYNTGLNYTTKDKVAFQHPAIFPEKLAEDHILSWSNPGDLVYDPFTGSGTTLKMAWIHGRQFIGSEISPAYVEIAENRLFNLMID